MAYQRHDKDNNPVTLSSYQRHDKDNNPVASIDTFVRHDVNNVADSPQPTSTNVTDVFGNTYKNFNADYVKHDVDNNPVWYSLQTETIGGSTLPPLFVLSYKCPGEIRSWTSDPKSVTTGDRKFPSFSVECILFW